MHTIVWYLLITSYINGHGVANDHIAMNDEAQCIHTAAMVRNDASNPNIPDVHVQCVPGGAVLTK